MPRVSQADYNRRIDGYVPSNYFPKYQKLSYEELIKLPETHTVAMINEVDITVLHVKRLYEGGKAIHKHAVVGAILALCHDSIFSVGVFVWLDMDFWRHNTVEEVFTLKEAEYRSISANKEMILVPICFRCHFTLCVVWVLERQICFYDSGPSPLTKPVWDKVVSFVSRLYESTFEVVEMEDIPRQTGDWTCGLFTVFYARSILYNHKMIPAEHTDEYLIINFKPVVLELITKDYDDRAENEVDRKFSLAVGMEDVEEVIPKCRRLYYGPNASVLPVPTGEEATDYDGYDDYDKRIVVEEDASDNEDFDESMIVYEDASESADKVGKASVQDESMVVCKDASDSVDKSNISVVVTALKREDVLQFLPTDEEARQIIDKDPEFPIFVGLKDMKLHTYNSDGSWKQMRSFVEIFQHLESEFSEQCQSRVLVLERIQQEIVVNPSLFLSWLDLERPHGEKCSTEYFYWGTSGNRNFVKHWLKRLHGIDIPDSSALHRLKERKKYVKTTSDYQKKNKELYNERRTRKRERAKAARIAAHKAAQDAKVARRSAYEVKQAAAKAAKAQVDFY